MAAMGIEIQTFHSKNESVGVSSWGAPTSDRA